MALSAIKTKAILKKTDKLLKKKLNSLQISKNIQTVGIIVNEGSDFNFDLLKNLQKEIASGSKNFSVLTCKKTKDSFNEFRGVIIKDSDFSWNGSLKSNEVTDFLTKPFDMLIDFTNNTEVYNNFLVAKSQAKFKVGYANIDDRLYDLMIDSDSIPLFINELIKYLKILQKLK